MTSPKKKGAKKGKKELERGYLIPLIIERELQELQKQEEGIIIQHIYRTTRRGRKAEERARAIDAKNERGYLRTLRNCSINLLLFRNKDG